MHERALRNRLRPHLPAVLPGALGVAVLLIWAEHDGGYDLDTWYWGALVLLAVLVLVRLARSPNGGRRAPGATAAVVLLGLYTAWSFASIAWASSPGDALMGSNRTLLYLIVFALFSAIPWSPAAALWMLAAYALGVGAIGTSILIRFATGHGLASLILGGRLIAPTGYFNSSVALFMTAALVATALSVRRELPAPVRGLLIGSACVSLQLALIGQSRGWLFTLPFVLIAALFAVRNRLRVSFVALLPILATLLPLHPFLAVYRDAGTAAFPSVASRAGHIALTALVIAVFVGTLLAWADRFIAPRPVRARTRRAAGVGLAALACAAAAVGGVVATHGRPLQFISKQWRGFSHENVGGKTSNFATVGSGRYDFWRVALDGFRSHPIGGLGQDNFADYYIVRRRTPEEPAWPHSLEMRLLVSTGAVGFALFAAFVLIALRAAAGALRPASRRDRRGRAEPASLGEPGEPRPLALIGGDPLLPAVAGIALLPLIDWLIHGSVDWFWEIPALSGPAFAFLGMAVSLAREVKRPLPAPAAAAMPAARPPAARIGIRVAGGAAVLAATVVLAFPYMAVREVSMASNVRSTDAEQALSDLHLAGELNPLWAQPGRVAGAIALETGQLELAQRSFAQATRREPGGWFGWFGKGLAESNLGEVALARHDLRRALAIQTRQPAIRLALARTGSAHPLDPSVALDMLLPVE